jgi:hypothetical protein
LLSYKPAICTTKFSANLFTDDATVVTAKCPTDLSAKFFANDAAKRSAVKSTFCNA